MSARGDHIGTVGLKRGVGPLLASVGVSVAGDGAFLTAAPLLATTLTDDPVTISVIAAANLLPWLVMGLPAGALVDRWPRRLVMVWADLCRAALLALVCVLVVTHQITAPMLVAAILLVGVAQCFFRPSRTRCHSGSHRT